MAYQLTGMDNHGILEAAIKTYDCTSESDVAKLPKNGVEGTQVLGTKYDEINNAPCGFGSTALIATGTTTLVYRLMPNNQWCKL